MQMLPEDEDGFIMIDELIEYLEHLRTDAMLNALVESDVLSLRTQLVLGFRRLGLGEEEKLNVWVIKDALLQADQICLTRLQIHVLLCLANPDSFGFVQIAEFLGVCCTIIPHMFNAIQFVETAEKMILDHAESQRRAENEELAALGGKMNKGGEEGEENVVVVDVDPETVEKTLQQILTLNDDQHRTPPALQPETIYNILSVNEKELQTIQLTSFEIVGFLAEMHLDSDGFVAYIDHIKKWVPIIFEQRKNQLLGRYTQVNAYETLMLDPPDLRKLESLFPLLPHVHNFAKGGRSGRRSGSKRRASVGDSDFGSIGAGSKREQSTDSKGSPVRRASVSGVRMERAGSKIGLGGLGAGRRMSSKAALGDGHHLVSAATKEPPAGRGFARRKARLAKEEAAKADALDKEMHTAHRQAVAPAGAHAHGAHAHGAGADAAHHHHLKHANAVDLKRHHPVEGHHTHHGEKHH